MPQRPLAAWTAVALLAGSTTPAFSAITTFDDRVAFESATGPELLRESFEDRPDGLIDLPYLALESGIGIDLTPADAYDAYVTDSTVFSLPSDGDFHLAFLFGTGTYSPTISLPAAALGFGFDISGYQDLDGSQTLEFELLSGEVVVESVSVAAPPVVGPGFIGVLSDQDFDGIRLVIEDGGQSGVGDFVGVDQLTVSFVPAPGAAAMLVIGGAFAGRRRRSS